MNKPFILASALLLSVCASPTWAENNMPNANTHGGHNMSNMAAEEDMSMENMDHSTMQGIENESTADSPMEHEMNHSTSTPMNNHDMAGMGHGAIPSGAVPTNARDPHAYSAGYTLESGPYVLPGPRQLRLADEHNFASLLVDRLEAVRTSDDTATAYDLTAWYGRDYDRIVLKAEGNYDNNAIEEASTELLWGHALATFWDSQLGLRYDSGEAPDRAWLAFGVQGLAPYWFEVNITGYLGKEGRTALNAEAEYELLITQKLILQPRIEATLHGKDDAEQAIGSGLSELVAGMRLRYEIRREFAPYIGIEWASKFSGTANYARDAGLDEKETQAVAGIRFWF